MQNTEEFPYSTGAQARLCVTVLLFLSAAFLLWWGGTSSLAEPRHADTLAPRQNLAVDGVWEFNVLGRGQSIRVPKSSLNDPTDFDRMVPRIAKQAKTCDVETEQRFNPPTLQS